MGKIMDTRVFRRRLLKTGASVALATAGAPGIIIPGRAKARQKTLRILKWVYPIAAYDNWLIEKYGKEWSEQKDTQVVVDRVGLGEVNSGAMAEAEKRQGHDLIMLLTPGAMYEDHVIDHREIYNECERRYGKPTDFAIRTTYNPRTGKYFGVSLGYQAAVTVYDKGLWDAVRVRPDSWANILAGGRQIRLLQDKPVGFSLAPEINGEWTMRAIMYCFGSSEQDQNGNPALNSKATLEAIKYVKALYDEAMTKDVLSWDAASNNRFMLNGEGSLTLDTVSIPRAHESMSSSTADNLGVGKMPEGSTAQVGPAFGLITAFIWSFAQNIEGAKRFLVDYIGHSRQALLTSGFHKMPVWPATVPDLAAVVTDDPGGGSPGTYRLLADAATWTTNIGHPGHTNAAISEIFHRGLIPTMFARAATGRLTAEDALDQAHQEVRQIFQKWKERGKV
jgi:multiple sugar transport system substrate-binding protein